MKKIALLLALWFCFSAWLAVAVPTSESMAQTPETESTAVFILPDSLREIGKSAFEGTAVEKVVLPDTVTFIGDRAFANNSRLTTIRIPKTVSSIGKHAFSNSIHVTIQGAEGSYAAIWARKHNIAFELERSALTWYTIISKFLQGSFLLFFNLGFVAPREQIWQCAKKNNYIRSMRPQDRAELNPIEYRFP